MMLQRKRTRTRRDPVDGKWFQGAFVSSGSIRAKSFMKIRWAALSLAVLMNLTALPVAAVDFSVAAVDFSVSAFGTLGYARSDRRYAYQRFIDKSGTFMRDSLAGLQVDAKFADKFGATVQVKVAPDELNDNRYEGTVSWAFLSYRPTNDWLIRAGKQRIALYVYSETLDVGVTYDFARLPTEMYSIISSNDITGLSVSKSWGMENGDLSLDGYWGKGTADFRFWIRDNIPPGAVFIEENVKAGGLVLSYKRNEDTYRLGVHRGVIKRSDGGPFNATFPFVALAPGIGYYQVDASLPGPGIPTIATLTGTVITLGAEVGLGSGFRVVSEFARTFIPHADISAASTRGYTSLLKRVDKWTPYVIYAFLRSAPGPRNLYNRVNNNTVPDIIPGAALINASQRAGADALIVYDQNSWAVGTSYSISATSKIKAEYLRAHIGQKSSLVDAPPGSNIRDQNINVFSLSYNFVF
jgi:hypothetical protein